METKTDSWQSHPASGQSYSIKVFLELEFLQVYNNLIAVVITWQMANVPLYLQMKYVWSL